MEFYGGVENWIKLFVSKASKQLNENANDKNSDGSLRTTSASNDASGEVNKNNDKGK